MYRLFRFFDEIKGLVKIIKTDRPLLFKILSVFTYICSCSYYICDNTLWFVGILIRSQAIDKSVKKGWKKKKNMFSLCRIVAYLIILLYSVFLDKRECSKKKEEVKTQSALPHTEEIKKLIDYRRRVRFYYLEIAISLLRYIMLTSSLKLRYH